MSTLKSDKDQRKSCFLFRSNIKEPLHWVPLITSWVTSFLSLDKCPYGLFTFTDPDSDSDSDHDFDPIPRVRSYDWDLNLTLCRVKSSVQSKSESAYEFGNVNKPLHWMPLITSSVTKNRFL